MRKMKKFWPIIIGFIVGYFAQPTVKGAIEKMANKDKQ